MKTNHQQYIEQRVIEEANYIIETFSTIRKVANKFGLSKSTIHNDMRFRLPEINKTLADNVKTIIQTNKEERTYRGGMATKEKHRLNSLRNI